MIKIKLIVIGLLLLSASIIAAGVSGTSWNELSPEMQTLLGEYKSDWGGLSKQQKADLINRGKSWLATSDKQQNKLWQRFERWQAMSQSQRMDMQKSYERFQTLSKHERQKLIKVQSRFEKMPIEKQRIMMQRFEQFQMRGEQPVMGIRQGNSNISNMSNLPDGNAMNNNGSIPTPDNRMGSVTNPSINMMETVNNMNGLGNMNNMGGFGNPANRLGGR